MLDIKYGTLTKDTGLSRELELYQQPIDSFFIPLQSTSPPTEISQDILTGTIKLIYRYKLYLCYTFLVPFHSPLAIAICQINLTKKSPWIIVTKAQ